MRHVMVWAWMAGCAAQAADGEVVTASGLAWEVAEYDCEPWGGDGGSRVELVVDRGAMISAEWCGRSLDFEETRELCQPATQILRFDDDVTIYCAGAMASVYLEDDRLVVRVISAPE